MDVRLLFALAMPSVLILSGCPKGSNEGADAKVYDYTKASVSDEKALIYNLIGRWYPLEEIERLDDDSMTPKQWCAREPARMEIFLDDVEVHCADGKQYNSPIARIERGQEGGIKIVLRGAEDAEFKHLLFKSVISHEDEPIRPKAKVEGSPCKEGVSDYARFPKIEILERQILDGRHCAQIQ